MQVTVHVPTAQTAHLILPAPRRVTVRVFQMNVNLVLPARMAVIPLVGVIHRAHVHPVRCAKRGRTCRHARGLEKLAARVPNASHVLMGSISADHASCHFLTIESVLPVNPVTVHIP